MNEAINVRKRIREISQMFLVQLDANKPNYPYEEKHNSNNFNDWSIWIQFMIGKTPVSTLDKTNFVPLVYNESRMPMTPSLVFMYMGDWAGFVNYLTHANLFEREILRMKAFNAVSTLIDLLKRCDHGLYLSRFVAKSQSNAIGVQALVLLNRMCFRLQIPPRLFANYWINVMTKLFKTEDIKHALKWMVHFHSDVSPKAPLIYADRSFVNRFVMGAHWPRIDNVDEFWSFIVQRFPPHHTLLRMYPHLYREHIWSLLVRFCIDQKEFRNRPKVRKRKHAYQKNCVFKVDQSAPMPWVIQGKTIGFDERCDITIRINDLPKAQQVVYFKPNLTFPDRFRELLKLRKTSPRGYFVDPWKLRTIMDIKHFGELNHGVDLTSRLYLPIYHTSRIRKNKPPPLHPVVRKFFSGYSEWLDEPEFQEFIVLFRSNYLVTRMFIQFTEEETYLDMGDEKDYNRQLVFNKLGEFFPKILKRIGNQEQFQVPFWICFRQNVIPNCLLFNIFSNSDDNGINVPVLLLRYIDTAQFEDLMFWLLLIRPKVHHGIPGNFKRKICHILNSRLVPNTIKRYFWTFMELYLKPRPENKVYFREPVLNYDLDVKVTESYPVDPRMLYEYKENRRHMRWDRTTHTFDDLTTAFLANVQMVKHTGIRLYIEHEDAEGPGLWKEIMDDLLQSGLEDKTIDLSDDNRWNLGNMRSKSAIERARAFGAMLSLGLHRFHALPPLADDLYDLIENSYKDNQPYFKRTFDRWKSYMQNMDEKDLSVVLESDPECKGDLDTYVRSNWTPSKEAGRAFIQGWRMFTESPNLITWIPGWRNIFFAPIRGGKTVTHKDLMRVIEFKCQSPVTRQIIESELKQLTDKERATFVHFVTSSTQLPQAHMGEYPITIYFNMEDNVPSAKTCVNELHLNLLIDLDKLYTEERVKLTKEAFMNIVHSKDIFSTM